MERRLRHAARQHFLAHACHHGFRTTLVEHEVLQIGRFEEGIQFAREGLTVQAPSPAAPALGRRLQYNGEPPGGRMGFDQPAQGLVENDVLNTPVAVKQSYPGIRLWPAARFARWTSGE